MNLLIVGLDILRFAFGAIRPFAGPLKVQIEITHRCNSRCKSCFFWRQKAMPEISVEIWKSVISDIKKIGGRRVAFGGGEPTLYPGIFELIRYAKEQGLMVSLGTNGLLLPQYHDLIANSGLDVIEISLDGPPEIHNENRGIPHAFETTMKGVHQLIQHNKRPIVQYNYTPNRINVSYLSEFVDVAVANHAEIISIEPAHLLNDQLHLTKSLFVPQEKIPQFEQQLQVILSKYKDILSPPIDYYRFIPEFFRDPLKINFSKRYRCVSGYGMLVIDPGGNVYGCPAKENQIGNVIKTPLKHLWRSSMHIEDIQRVKLGHHKPCWLNSVSPLNMFYHMIKTPTSWKEIISIAKKEINRRV